MRKVVILVVFVLILAVLGIWYFYYRPSPVWTAAEGMKTCNAEVQFLVPFLKALEKPNANDCSKLDDDVLRVYCLAKFGVNVCNETERLSECNAILQHNPAGCGDDWTCHAVLGNEAGCRDNFCVGLARRDLSLLTNPMNCEQLVEKASASVDCRRSAATPEMLAACLNQSSQVV
ncbi:Uncharacterised protein [uncultured archaeon]|nr:Uncharacterised protein [uncultured archaeon]